MKHIETLHLFLFDLIRKPQSRGVSHGQVDRALNTISLSLFNRELAYYEKTGIISSRLKNFRVTEDINIVEGAATLPADYAHYIDARDEDGNPIDNILGADWNTRAKSLVVPPTDEYPICKVEGEQLQVMPVSKSTCYLTYFKYPATMLFAYSNQGNHEVYNEAASTDTDWPRLVHPELILGAMSYLGVNLKTDEALNRFEMYQQQIRSNKEQLANAS